MGKTILVSLISEQTLPNIQFIKWYLKNNTNITKLLFISTKKMEEKGKSEDIESALKCKNTYIGNIDFLITDENDINKTLTLLEYYFSENKADNIVVNITGGTKIMSLATYQYFISKKNTEIFYQPIGMSLQRLYPEQELFEISELLTLDEYLKAYGIEYKIDNSCVKDWEYNKNVFEIVKTNRDLIKGMIALQNNSWFRNKCDKKDFLNFEIIDDDKFLAINNEFATKENICALIKKFNFDSTKVCKRHIRYITGGWFEEFVYQKICNEYENVEKENVALNVNISKGNDKNELDVIYLDKDSKLHVIECKSFLDGKDGSKILTEALYKLQAIIKTKFGLFVKHHLYTKSIIDKETPLNRAREFGIDLKDGNDL